MSRLIEVMLSIALLGLAIVVIGPVMATIFTPGWVEAADTRDWASMAFFLCVAVAFLLFALRLAFGRTRPPRGRLRSRDFWTLAGLALVATVCAAVASHWTIALPGLLPVAAAVLLARQRARQERLVLVESDNSDLPPRSSFTTSKSSGSRPV
jgi:hypothetical protein